MTTEPFELEKLLRRLDWSESDDLEFKSARGGLPRSLWETYSAMANTHGGVILLGVEDDGNISGVKDVTRLKRDLWNVLNNRGKVNLRIQQITGVHAADITRIFQSLVERQLLVKKAQGRWSWYHLPEIENSKNVDSDSIHKEVGSIHKNQWNELLRIAEPVRRSPRMEPGKLEQVIVQLCQNQWLTGREIGRLLNRNADGLRSRYLVSMVAQGVLKLRFPDKPSHSDQAYRSKYVADLNDGV
jgi:predicted HTH transcriptional regulator